MTEEPQDWTPEEKAELVDFFGVYGITDLTKAEVILAKAVGLYGDHERIEAAFGLDAGSIKELMKLPEFVALAERYALKELTETSPDIDFGRALDEKKRKVARLMVDDELSQTDAAEAAGVSSRTIRNWEKDDAFFVAYVKQLIKRKEGRAKEESRKEKNEITVALHETKRAAIMNVRDAVRGGDVELSAKIFLRELNRPH